MIVMPSALITYDFLAKMAFKRRRNIKVGYFTVEMV
jgi:hypothetical protein